MNGKRPAMSGIGKTISSLEHTSSDGVREQAMPQAGKRKSRMQTRIIASHRRSSQGRNHGTKKYHFSLRHLFPCCIFRSEDLSGSFDEMV